LVDDVFGFSPSRGERGVKLVGERARAQARRYVTAL
jgi:hypothetical protein